VDTQARKYSFVSLDEREPREGEGLVADGPLDLQAKALDPSDLHPGRPLELLDVGVVDRPAHLEPMGLHVVQLIQAHDVDELGVSGGHDPHVVDRRPRARVAEADAVTVVGAVPPQSSRRAAT
jgi:hypothetical protein